MITLITTYQNEILGGLLIGIASALPLLFEGRIAGVSAYAANSLRPVDTEGRTGLLFVVGLVFGGIIWRISGGKLPEPSGLDLSVGLWILAGLLVGFGSRMGGGCTSGHGVCGLGRASPRSFVSVIVFMSLAMLVTFLMELVL
jgi:uncharacterized membrane protein YedE/YeeE